MKINAIDVPDEIIFDMKCGRKIIRFDFDEPKYKDLANELSQIKYSMHLERGLTAQDMTTEKFWKRRCEKDPFSIGAINRLNNHLPDEQPRVLESKMASTGIIAIDVSDGRHYFWDEAFAHIFEAVQEKLLFGHAFDEKTNELVFFERITKMTEIENAVIRAYLPNTLEHVRKYVGTAVKFFIGLDEFFIEYNHGWCMYSAGEHSFCPAKIRPLIYEGEFLFRYIGNAGKPFHSHSKSLVPMQNKLMTREEAIAAIDAPKEIRLRDPVTGHLVAPEVEFKSKAEFIFKRGAKLLSEPGTDYTYYDAQQSETANGRRWKCSRNRYGCRAFAYVNEIGGIVMVAFGNTPHTGHK